MNMSVEMRQTLLFFLVFWPVFGAFVSWLADMVSAKLRDNAVTAVVAVEFAVMVGMLTGFFQDGTVVTGSMAGFGGWGLNLEMDGFRAVYGTVASLMWLGTGLFGREYFASHYKSLGRYNFFYLFTLGATMGVFLGADLFTVFIFFEIMSFTSYTWVVHDETPEAMRAGQTYLAVAIFGGMAMLFGLAMLYTTAGTLTLSELYSAVSEVPEKGKIWAAGLLILTGFGALGYAPLVRMSKGEKQGSEQAKLHIVANCFEALIGAIYLDKGYDVASDFIAKHILTNIDDILREGSWRDPKSQLQEISQRIDNETPDYRVLEENGPDHDKTFTVAVYVNGQEMGRGTGGSKQQAQQAAARMAIDCYRAEGK